jgi:hypothetical protein
LLEQRGLTAELVQQAQVLVDELGSFIVAPPVDDSELAPVAAPALPAPAVWHPPARSPVSFEKAVCKRADARGRLTLRAIDGYQVQSQAVLGRPFW